VNTLRIGCWIPCTVFVIIGILPLVRPAAALSEEPPGEPKSIRKTCGTCPDGYATTGVTHAPEICKDGDPTLVQCVPLGANMLPVCGSCPEGYREVGSSSVPSRCGTQDGGRLSQCQLEANVAGSDQRRKSLSTRLRHYTGSRSWRSAASTDISSVS
jgi:hypothetical protein